MGKGQCFALNKRIFLFPKEMFFRFPPKDDCLEIPSMVNLIEEISVKHIFVCLFVCYRRLILLIRVTAFILLTLV